MIKISDVSFLQIQPIGFKESWSSESIWSPVIPCFIIRITAENGVVGYGEASSQVWYLGETAEQIASLLHIYALRLKGTDATNIAATNHIMDMAHSGAMPGSRGARSGVDMALHDLLGRLWDVPVSVLLGGARRSRLDMMTNLYHKTPEAMAKASAEFVANGCRGLKIKVGDVIWKEGLSASSIATETAFLEAALDVVPKDVFIDADCNQAWTNAGLAVRRLERFSKAENLAIEQPLHYANLSGHHEIRMRSTVPVILDESIWSPEAAQQAIQAGACDRVVLKTNRVGGLSKARNLIAICEAAGVGVSVDTNPYTLLGDTAICHLGVTTQSHYPICCDGHQTFVRLADPTAISGGIDMSKGYVEMPNAPGIGVDVDWEKLQKIAI
jgi:L-alanine-DL-glutamate epimerase-like enolase superfamily enzyme